MPFPRRTAFGLLAAFCALTPRPGSTQQTDSSVVASSAAPVVQPQAPSTRQTRKGEQYYAVGVHAMEKGDVEAAEKAFAKAAKADPSNPEYSVDYQITRQHTVTRLVQESDKAKILGQPDVARAKLAEALVLDPKNPEVARHIDAQAYSANLPDPVDTLDATLASAIEVTPTPGKHTFHLKSTEQEVLRRVLEPYGIRIVTDESVPSQTIRFDAEDVGYDQAAKMLCLVTHTFMVPLDPVRLLVAKDSKENHAKYDRLSVETIRMPGLTANEFSDISNVARNVIGVQQTAMEPNAGLLTVRATTGNLMALNRTLQDLLDGKSEVLLDVKVYEVQNTKTSLVGVQPPQSTTLFNVPTELNSVIAGNSSLVQQIISSGLASAGDYAAIAAILIASGEVSSSILNSPFATFGGGLTLTGLTTNGITGNLSFNSADTRSLDQIQLRLDDNAEGTIQSGVRYPIITSSYSNIASSSVSIPGITSAGLSSVLSGLGISASSLSTANPIPQVQYQDLGLTLKVTPRVERTDDVTLKIDFKILALQGASLNGLPVLTNRSYQADIHLVNGASALVIGDLSRQESNAVSGTPGLTELPGFAGLGNTTKEYDVSNLAILITPHIIRRRHTNQMGPMIPLPRHS